MILLSIEVTFSCLGSHLVSSAPGVFVYSGPAELTAADAEDAGGPRGIVPTGSEVT